ncbi:hypothetical protein ABB30_15395, partial [Stenotrophomonas ginsengisoli]
MRVGLINSGTGLDDQARFRLIETDAFFCSESRCIVVDPYQLFRMQLTIEPIAIQCDLCPDLPAKHTADHCTAELHEGVVVRGTWQDAVLDKVLSDRSLGLLRTRCTQCTTPHINPSQRSSGCAGQAMQQCFSNSAVTPSAEPGQCLCLCSIVAPLACAYEISSCALLHQLSNAACRPEPDLAR